MECGWPNGADWREDFWPNEPYMVSKVGISAMTFIQQRQFDKDERQDLVVNCVHPGRTLRAIHNKKGYSFNYSFFLLQHPGYVQTSATNFQGDKNIEEGKKTIMDLVNYH